jgi:hypothetical protein
MVPRIGMEVARGEHTLSLFMQSQNLPMVLEFPTTSPYYFDI